MSPVLGDRVRFTGSESWAGEGTVTDGAIVEGVTCSSVDWDGEAAAELDGWIPNEMLEVIE